MWQDIKQGYINLTSQRWYHFLRGFLVILGGFVVHLTLGTIYSFGNIAPYIVSYIRNQSHPEDLTQGVTTWIFALALMGQGGAMFIGGQLVRKIGPRWTTLMGGWIMSLGVALSYFTIKVSFWLLLLSYGLLFGVGVGLAYIGPLTAAMKWMPKWKGLANGIVVAGFGFGALIFNFVQTAYVNPNNLKPHKEGSEEYFTQLELLHRVPFLFLILGGAYAVMQLFGSLLITTPPGDSNSIADTTVTSPPNVAQSGHYREVDDNSTFVPKPSASKSLINTRKSSNTGGDADKPRSSSPMNGFADADHPPTYSETSQLLNGGNAGPKYSNGSQGATPERNKDVESSLSVSVTWSQNVVTSLKPLQMLKKPTFYILWFMFMFNGIAVLLTATLYKFFGLQVHFDDHFLAVVGSVSAIFNGLGRNVWGNLADRVSYKFSLVLLSGIKTVFLLTLYFSSWDALGVAGDKALYFIWICVIFFCIGGNFSVFPTAVARAYGVEYVSVNYGLLFTSQVVAGPVGAFLATILKAHLMISAFSAIGFFLALLYRPKRYISLQPQ